MVLEKIDNTFAILPRESVLVKPTIDNSGKVGTIRALGELSHITKLIRRR